MTIGEYIKYLRKCANLSQEELGQMLNPQVNKSAVQKWESGRVENLKRCHIEQMSKIFDVRPSQLMCFDSKYDSAQVAEEVKLLELAQNVYGKDCVKMLELFSQLNQTGRTKVISDMSDMVELSKYTQNSR